MDINDINTSIVENDNIPVLDNEELVDFYHRYNELGNEVIGYYFNIDYDKLAWKIKNITKNFIPDNIPDNQQNPDSILYEGTLNNTAKATLYYINVDHLSNEVVRTTLSETNIDLTNPAKVEFDIANYTKNLNISHHPLSGRIIVTDDTTVNLATGAKNKVYQPANYVNGVRVDGLYYITLEVTYNTDKIYYAEAGSLIIPNLNTYVLKDLKKPYRHVQLDETKSSDWIKIVQKIEAIKICLRLGEIEEASRILSSLTYKPN